MMHDVVVVRVDNCRNAKYNTSLNTGLQLNHAERQQQRQVVGANIIPPPVDCPPWLCCLLPCLLKTKKMKYYQSLQAKVVEVRGGEWRETYIFIVVSPGDIVLT